MPRTPAIPEDLRALMADIGPNWARDVPGHIQAMLEGFTPILRDAPKGGIEVRSDIVYGDHLRHALDVFLPESGENRAAVLFVHGGAFVEGHRNRTPEIYSNVLYYFARHGVVGINVGYRLADAAPYPGAAHDIAAAVAWTRAHAQDLGIDPSRIFLMGHSAGGGHAATYAYDARVQPPGGSGLAGLIVVSGRVRADNLPENPNARKVETYYGADASLYEDRTPITHVGPDSLPTFIAWGEFENPLIDVYCLELAHRLAVAKRRAPPVLRMAGHNHFSTIAHFNTAEDDLGRALLDFIASPR